LKKASFALSTLQLDFDIPTSNTTPHRTAKMKTFITVLLAAICAALAMAATTSHVELKPIVVSYPKGTPYSEIDELKAAIAEVVS
jgi:hypothetical protein